MEKLESTVTEILEHEVWTKITGVVNTELCGPLQRREKNNK
jgi:hypothetical protein